MALVQQGLFLQAGGIVEWPDGTVAAQFRFSHYLYQEVLYERLPAGRQVRLHRQIGQRLEMGYGLSAPEKAAELAVHFVRGREPKRAVTYLQFAAEQAMQRNAYREAIEHLRQALEFLRGYPDLPERAQFELTLQTTLGPALIMTRGWAAPEAEQAYIRANELCQQVGDTRQLSSVLYGLASLYELRGQYSKAQALLEEQLQLPHDPQDYRSQLESHELLACSAFHQGAFTQALAHADQALSFCDPQDTSLTAILGENPAVSSHHWAGLALWFLGYPDQSSARSQQALHQAKNLAYTFSLAHAHEQATMLHQLRREEQMVYQRAEATITAAVQGGFTYWLGVGQILRGWAGVVQEQAEWGLAQLRQGLDICQATGATLDYPYFLYLLADACGRLGRLEEGIATLSEAFTLVDRSRAFFHEAELHRLQGTLLLQLDPHKNLAAAEASFQQALDIACRQQAKSLELRAAVSLSHLWHKQGRADQARSMLAEICNWFSEGFDTVDWQEARTLLELLGGQVKPARRETKEKITPPTSRSTRPPTSTKQRFVQTELIATGGMGQVYLGRDTETGQLVAIKRLRPEVVAHSPETIKRFIREGEALRQLNHPNIVKMLAAIESDDQPMIVMEYVSGGSLRDLLDKQPQLPLAQLLTLSLELADALARVHHLGIIHRDLKPANVLLAEDGAPRLTDFGVAYLIQPDTRLTQEGAILGTSVYLSPEAWRGEELDARSDIWSFGAMLYEMLAGRPPFDAKQIAVIITAILNDSPPDLYQFRPDAPPMLVELIKHMLVKERELRLDSIRQVAPGWK